MLEVIEEAGDEPGCAGFGSDEKLEPVDDREGDLGLGESDKEEVEDVKTRREEQKELDLLPGETIDRRD